MRVLVNQNAIKYLKIDSGVWASEDICFTPTLIESLPSLPAGDWNLCHISKSPAPGSAIVAAVTRTCLPRIHKLWHPVQIEYLDLKVGRKLRSNVYEAEIPDPKSSIVIKFTRFSWEIDYLDAEMSTHQWIDGHHIASKFLGHLMEHGRAIGFLMEKIVDCRYARVGDLTLCQNMLSKLHRLGIKHGDTNKYNFLIHDGEATLIDFDHAQRCPDDQILAEESGRLLEELQDTSSRGGILTVDENFFSSALTLKLFHRLTYGCGICDVMSLWFLILCSGYSLLLIDRSSSSRATQGALESCAWLRVRSKE